MGHLSDTTHNFLFWLSRKIDFPLVSPVAIQVSLTYRCNLECKMCKIVNLLPADEELSTQQILHIIDETAKNGITEAVFSGGEPFLRRDLFEICGYCHGKGLTSVITTNGTLIDRYTAKDITKSKIGHIHLSLDGLEDTNDFFRGKGVFKKIIKAIEILNEERRKNRLFSIGIALTVMDRNVKELYEVVRLADDLNVDVINFQPLVSNNTNFLDRNLSMYWVREESVAVLNEEITKIRRFKPRHLAIYEEPSLELLIKYYQRELSRKDWICFGGFKTVFICYAKRVPLVYSCHGICGNLDEVSLKKAWASKEAYRLRSHSKNCQSLCMQSCYSLESAQSLGGLTRSYLKKR